jgi:hypothetical protein
MIIDLSRCVSGLPCRKATLEVFSLFEEPTFIGGDIEAVPVIGVPPAQIVVPPVTEAVGASLTFIDLLTELIQVNTVTVYVIIVFPLDTPVTTPPADIVAAAVLLLVHTPPDVASVKVIVFPTHTPSSPPIAATAGGGFTVTLAVTDETHPFAAPVIVNIEVCEVLVRFVNTPSTEDVPPGPAGSMPTRLVVLSLVQLYVVAPENIIGVKGLSEHTD